MPTPSIERLYRSQHPLARVIAPILRAAGHLRRFVLQPQHRSETLTRLRHPATHLQGATCTAPNRYPELFAACRQFFSDQPHPRILSFGCSTGEEVFTLAQYLPNAHITGVDLNRWCIQQARAAAPAAATYTFLFADSPAFAATPPFDAIFCMAVLQRTENRTHTQPSAHPGFPFRHFEQQLELLDRKLNPGGLLFLDECDFSLLDTSLAPAYRALEFPGNRVLRERPLFGPDNRLRTSRYLADRCFLKLSPSTTST